MVRSIKIVIMVMPLFLLVLLVATGVYAQPLGIGSPQKQQQSQRKVLSSANGRFVFGQISNSNKDKFMLDTVTGRLWRIGKTGKIGIFLKSVPYLNTEGECSILPGKISGSVLKKSEKK
jgi:hypothetical protein